MSEKKKQKKGLLLINDTECFALSNSIFNNQNYIFYIFFFNCQSFKCGQQSHNYIKRDLGVSAK